MSFLLDVNGTPVNGLGLVVLGTLVGLIAGMFGAGGGFLLTPLLGIIFGIPMPTAVGSGLCQMVGASSVAALRHRDAGQGEPRFAILMVPGSLLGVGLGARCVELAREIGDVTVLGKTMPFATALILALYVVFLSGTAGLLWLQGGGGPDATAYARRGPLSRLAIPPLVDLPRVPLTHVSATLIAYVGVLIGFLSGILGVGGGIVLIPTLVYGFGFPFRHAVGTGIAVTWIVSVVGTFAHAALGNVDLGLALVLLVGSSVSAQFGALLTTRVPASVLRRGFAGIVAATACVIVADFLST